MAEEMTDLVDDVSIQIEKLIGEVYKLVEEVKEDQNPQLISELQRAEEAYKQNGQLNKVIEELISVECEFGQGGEALVKIKELRDTLKAEAKDLMEKVHTLNSKKNYGGDSEALGQVRQLQLDVREKIRGP